MPMELWVIINPSTEEELLEIGKFVLAMKKLKHKLVIIIELGKLQMCNRIYFKLSNGKNMQYEETLR